MAALLPSAVLASMSKESTPKKAVVLAVFGTTYPNALQSILNLKEKTIQAVPGMPVKIAFTSEIIRAKWEKRANDSQWRLALGEPGDVHPYTEDIRHAAGVLGIDVDLARKNSSSLVYMGHGNEIFSTGAYVELEAALRDANPDVTIFIGNVEGFPEPERVIKNLKKANVDKITLLPLMVVAGNHASNDMSGDKENSWKTRFEAAGIEVVPVLRGLGEVDQWADIYVEHLRDAMMDNGF